MTDAPRPRGRLQLLGIAAVFFAPLLFAAWLYYAGEPIQPQGRSNHGALLEPIINLDDALPGAALHEYNAGRWLLVYQNRGSCEGSCRDSLYTIRQSRLMLGTEMDRVVRIFLHGDSAPDTVFIADEHKGLMTLEDEALSELLDDKKPAELSAGGYYLIDPHGNLVMYFHPDIYPGDMVEDIKRLLRLSHIG